MSADGFRIVGMQPTPPKAHKKNRLRGKPVISAALLFLIVFGCMFAELLMTKDPTYMDLAHSRLPPDGEFLFGADTMGRDLFSMIWYGGRISLAIGFLSMAISAVIAVVVGTASGLAPKAADAALMRLTEILLSIPNLLLVILLQAILGKANVLSLSVVIGVTSWLSIAKVVRTEVQTLRGSEFILASRAMGGGFVHVLRRHLAPNFFPSIMFMMVMNVRSAMIAESTLSFMGLGLPVNVITWGSMLSLAQNALISGAWWMILIPGLFLITTLVCITNLGNYLRKSLNKGQRNL
ncbi:MAG: ABC transporter permease [Clostridia bacterium]|nr:ABC transporter permease [Clostridia bacterium]